MSLGIFDMTLYVHCTCTIFARAYSVHAFAVHNLLVYLKYKCAACLENSAVFLVSAFQYISSAVVFSRGPPFRSFLFTNRMLHLHLLLLLPLPPHPIFFFCFYSYRIVYGTWRTVHVRVEYYSYFSTVLLSYIELRVRVRPAHYTISVEWMGWYDIVAVLVHASVHAQYSTTREAMIIVQHLT